MALVALLDENLTGMATVAAGNEKLWSALELGF